MSENLKLWASVCTTDPDMVERVEQRGGFSAIDSYYTIKRLTEMFGPIGKGWGGDVQYQFQGSLVVCIASFWHLSGEEKCFSPAILTSNEMFGKTRVDEDAGKKSLTDAITKWASYLGFSADVFEGKFDDNKYVESLKAQKKKARQKADQTAPESKPYEPPVIELEKNQHGHEDLLEYKAKLLNALDEVETESDWISLWNLNKSTVEKRISELSKSVFDDIKAAFSKKYKVLK